MLYGVVELHISTDHKNNTFQKFNTQRLFLEEYGPTFHFIEGKKNTLADMLSRLSFSKRQSDIASTPRNPQDLYRNADLFKASHYRHYDPLDPNSKLYYSMATKCNYDLAHCFAHLPDQAGVPFVLDF